MRWLNFRIIFLLILDTFRRFCFWGGLQDRLCTLLASFGKYVGVMFGAILSYCWSHSDMFVSLALWVSALGKGCLGSSRSWILCGSEYDFCFFSEALPQLEA